MSVGAGWALVPMLPVGLWRPCRLPGAGARVSRGARVPDAAGTRTVFGLDDLTRGRTVARNGGASLEKARRRGFLEYVEGPATGFAPGWDEGAAGGEADEETGAADASQPATACSCASSVDASNSATVCPCDATKEA